MTTGDSPIVDLLVIGGGINGAGIARDAAGRGLSVVLCEKDDLAQGTSSRSGKYIHGGLRYLEYYEFRLVREALTEREVLLKAAPHIIWPMRIVLPHSAEQRPAWLVRLGLFLYDHLGKRNRLPGCRSVDLVRDPAGQAIQPRFTRGFEYSDCWVDDARLVVINALDAAERGARVFTRTACTAAAGPSATHAPTTGVPAPTTTTAAKAEKDKKPKDETTTSTGVAAPPPPVDLPAEAIVPNVTPNGTVTQNGIEAPSSTPEGDAVALIKEKHGREAKLIVEIPVTSWQTKFDEAAAQSVYHQCRNSHAQWVEHDVNDAQRGRVRNVQANATDALRASRAQPLDPEAKEDQGNLEREDLRQAERRIRPRHRITPSSARERYWPAGCDLRRLEHTRSESCAYADEICGQSRRHP